MNAINMHNYFVAPEGSIILRGFAFDPSSVRGSDLVLNQRIRATCELD
jgi:hypothetical protein